MSGRASVVALGAAALALAAGCRVGSTAPGARETPGADTVRIPLIDMGSRTYKGFAGGLYPNGSNTIPAAHLAEGVSRARAIQPLDVNGNPSASGRYVLLSLGMSNTTQEFCAADGTLNCTSWSFMGQAASDPAVNRSTLVIVNGARGGQAATTWTSPTSPNYDMVRDTRLAPLGLSEKQVQVVWVKQAVAGPRGVLPASDADAYTLETHLGNTVRALRVRYPNLQQVFLSSRIYAGYANTTLNPEPYAYEGGFAVKWLVQAQIDQRQRGAVVDARAGDLDYTRTAPWLAWGPYLWADGLAPRSDRLIWERADLEGDGTHPSQSAERKVGALLLDFFKSSPVTSCWFLAGARC